MNKLLSTMSAVLLLISHGAHAMQDEERSIAFSGRAVHSKPEDSGCYTRTLRAASSAANCVLNLCNWVIRNPKKVLTFSLLALPSVRATTSSAFNTQMCFPERCGDSPSTFPMATLCERKALETGSERLMNLCKIFPSVVDSRFNVANMGAFRADYLNPLALYLTDDSFRHDCIKTESLNYRTPRQVSRTHVDFQNAKRVEQGYYATAEKGEVLFTGSISNCVAVGISGATNQGKVRSFLAHIDQDAIDAMDYGLANIAKSQNSSFGNMDDFIRTHANVEIFLVSGDITQLSYVKALLEHEHAWVPIEAVYHRPWSATLSGEKEEGCLPENPSPWSPYLLCCVEKKVQMSCLAASHQGSAGSEEGAWVMSWAERLNAVPSVRHLVFFSIIGNALHQHTKRVATSRVATSVGWIWLCMSIDVMNWICLILPLNE